MTTDRHRLRVLFLCTGNSARSQLAEAILRHVSDGGIDVASAGSTPAAEVHPMTLQTLARLGIDAAMLYPKSWNQFVGETFDYVVTVCDQAADRCPVFPGAAKRMHWGFEDPAALVGSTEQQRAFDRVASELFDRMRIFLAPADISEGSHV